MIRPCRPDRHRRGAKGRDAAGAVAEQIQAQSLWLESAAFGLSVQPQRSGW